MRLRVAIIVPGGVRSGLFDQGIPILESWISEMASQFDITVFSMVEINLDAIGLAYKLIGTNLDYKESSYKKIRNTISLIKVEHEKKEFDLFHGVWLFPAGFVACYCKKKFRKPAIAGLQGGDLANVQSIGYGGNKHFLKRLLNDYILSRLDVISCLSHFQKLDIPKRYYHKTRVAPYGLAKRYEPKKTNSLEEPLKIVQVGNLIKIKDQITTMKVLKKISLEIPAQVKFIGADYSNEMHFKYARRLGVEDNIQFLGHLPHEEAIEQIKQSDILIHPSLYEGQGMVVAEAFAVGTLVVGTNVGLIHDLKNRCCLATEPGDVEGLVSLILKLTRESELRERLKSNAIAWSQEWTMSSTVECFKNHYIELLKTIDGS